jgi:phage terminase large subunit-like protein
MPEAVRKPAKHPHINAAEVAVKYANDVINGTIIAGKLVQYAAKRFLEDIANGALRGIIFDKDAAQHVVDFFGFLQHSKGEWGGEVFKLEPWQVFILANVFGWYKADGTRRFNEVYIEIARKNGKTTLLSGIGLYLLLMDDEPGAEVYCVSPYSKILTEDLHWVNAGDLAVGQSVWGFDEYAPKNETYRKLRPSVVLSTTKVRQPSYRLYMEDGRYVECSATHLWLARRERSSQKWLTTESLKVGDSLRDIGCPWREENNKDAGYLAGVFDGEACLTTKGKREDRNGYAITFPQNPGIVLEHVKELLARFSFSYSEGISKKVKKLAILGGLRESLRFLGAIRPKRLLAKVPTWLAGASLGRAGRLKITKIEFLGTQEVIAIGTSTATLIVNGFLSHNCAATKKDQARICFDEAVRMRKSSSFLSARIVALRSNLHVVSTSSKFEPLSSEDDTLDGLNIHGAIIDELHAHPDRKLYDVLFESTKSRRQPLIISITTAGYDREGICYKQREFGSKIVEGILSNRSDNYAGDNFFAFIACIDEDDDWTDERNWYKANPNLGICVKLEGLRQAATKAKEDPTALNSFLRKHLNKWTSQDTAWMDPDKWSACNIAGKDKNGNNAIYDVKKLRKAAIEYLKDRQCFGGLDLSSKIDISSFSLIFPPTNEDKRWHVLCWNWVPELNVPERVKKDRIPYDVWIREGFIEKTDGNVVDQDTVREKIKEIKKLFIINEIGFDSWNSTQISLQLEQDGLKMVETRQGYKTFSEPMKEMMALVLSKKIEHYGDPVLSWAMNNVAATCDPAGNIKPDKEKAKEKIDPAVASLMALARAIANPVLAANPYNKRGITFI